jgi:large subunit ribosomal protein L31
MRQGIHPKYYPEAKVICSCGATWTTGSTVEVLRTDVCSSCHPFFTGEQRIIDTAGQVDRFQQRLKRQTMLEAEQRAREELGLRKREQSVLNQQIEALDLSDRVLKALTSSGMVRIGDLVGKLKEGEKELLALEGVGPKAVEEINEQLQALGLVAESK